MLIDTKRGVRVRPALAFFLLAVLGAHAQVGARSLLNGSAPQFVLPDLTGQNIDLSRLHGKVVLLNFWATWCAPCAAEMPVFNQWQHQHGSQGFEVIGISMDDDSAPVRAMVRKMRVDYPIAMGNAVLGRRYGGVLGLPLTFLIDRQGVIRAQFQGEADLAKIDVGIRRLLDMH